MSHKLTAQIVRYCDILQFSLLRGSGLKYYAYEDNEPCLDVLPLAREWIEINSPRSIPPRLSVLPLAREWIEIIIIVLPSPYDMFSLLRGSGLKSSTGSAIALTLSAFSLLRGSGLKCLKLVPVRANVRSPSCEGVD